MNLSFPQERSRTSVSCVPSLSPRAATWSLTCGSTPVTSHLLAGCARKGSRERWIWGDTGRASMQANCNTCPQARHRVLLPSSQPPIMPTCWKKTMQKAVMIWQNKPPLMFLSSSICPQMSQRVVILRTIVGHPFQCLLPSQFDDIHLWGRIIAFSTCITVIGPLCTAQSIQPEYQTENVVFCQGLKLWWIFAGNKSKSGIKWSWGISFRPISFSRLPKHGITAATSVTKEPKKYTKITLCLLNFLCSLHCTVRKIWSSLDTFEKEQLSLVQIWGIGFSCWQSYADGSRPGGFAQEGTAGEVSSDTCNIFRLSLFLVVVHENENLKFLEDKMNNRLILRCVGGSRKDGLTSVIFHLRPTCYRLPPTFLLLLLAGTSKHHTLGFDFI